MTNSNSEAHKFPSSPSWLSGWDPEDDRWSQGRGKRIARRTLTITTANLTAAFAVWFLVSALAVRLEDAGFELTKAQLYWLTAMPGLAGGSFRLIHMFLVPIFGTRHVVSVAGATLVIPLTGWYFAVQNPDTSYSVLLVLAFLAGLGGGCFSSYMPSTSLFFPKREQGLALGVQAGIGNFGVSLVQFLTPWLIGFSMIGSAQAGPDGSIWLQNAILIWIPIVIGLSIWAWFGLRSVPLRANMREQMDIFRDKHTYTMTSLYVMTFGVFSGMAAAFPTLIKNQFGDFANAPDPLTYAFIGPLVGSLMRVIAGPVSDKLGGAKVTQFAGIGLTIFCAATATFVVADTRSDFTPFLLCMVGIFFFSGIGNASTFKQIPMLFEKRKAAGVIGWTAAIAAYGPFLFSVLISFSVTVAGSPRAFFYGLTVFCGVNVLLNWHYFARKNAPNPC